MQHIATVPKKLPITIIEFIFVKRSRVTEFKPCYSVSFGKGLHNRGVDHWGHSLNDPMEGLVDYKNWTKTARYSPQIIKISPHSQ